MYVAYNDPKDAFNGQILTQHDGLVFQFEAIDIIASEYGTEQAIQKAQEYISAMPLTATRKLMQVLKVREGMPVELSTNIDVADGLCNGTSGSVCVLTGGRRQAIMWVHFDDKAVGTALRKHAPVVALQAKHYLPSMLTPIYVITKELFNIKILKSKAHGGLFFKRTEFPLVIACGVPLHHCQGSTFKEWASI